MGMMNSMTAHGTLESNRNEREMLLEQIETNRLLRKLAGEPEAPLPASAAAWSATRKGQHLATRARAAKIEDESYKVGLAPWKGEAQ